MPFIVSATESVEAMSVQKDTAREAFKTAMDYIQRGLASVTVRDLKTGDVFDEQRIRQVVELTRRQEDNA